MSAVLFVSDDQRKELIKRFRRAGGTHKDLDRLLTDDGAAMRFLLTQLQTYKPISATSSSGDSKNGLSMLQDADAHLVKSGIDPTCMHWTSEATPIDQPGSLSDGLIVGVCDFLSSLKRTVEYYWGIIQSQYPKSVKSDQLRLSSSNLRDFRDPNESAWTPFTRRWFTLDFRTHLGSSPLKLREQLDPSRVPGVEVLAALALHPELLVHSGLVGVSKWRVPALEVTYPGDKLQWQGALCLEYDAHLGGVVLFSRSANQSLEGWTCPTLVG